MRGGKLTVTLHIGGEQIEKLTPEQCERIAEKLGEVMSTYYTANPDEYRNLKNSKKK